MSSWAEPIWAVKRIRKFFEFDRTLQALNTSINNYSNQTQEINAEIETVAASLENLSDLTQQRVSDLTNDIQSVQNTYTQLLNKANLFETELTGYTVICSNDIPSGTYHENSICFITTTDN